MAETKTNPQKDKLDFLGMVQDFAKSQHENSLNPYQQGVMKGLIKAGQEHATQALQMDVPAEHIVEKAGLGLNANPQMEHAKGLFSSAQVTSDGNIQDAGLFGGFTGNTTRSLLDNLLKASEINKNNRSAGGTNPEEAINRLATLNTTIDEKLPGYQAIQTADGNFIVRPKPSGMMAQLSPEEQDSISDSLISGQMVPSQLPRLQKSQVVAAALQKDPNYNPAKADIDYAVNKAGAGNFEKLYNNVTSFERTFRKNADVALKLSDNFDRSKVPLINRAIMAGKLNVTGDPEASRLATAVYTVATEYARLTSAPGATGSQITDSAREEARNMLNTWQNQGTIRGLLDPESGIMSIDAQNRIDALNETRDEIKGRYGKSDSKKSSSIGRFKVEVE